MAKYTGKLTFKNLEKYASENGLIAVKNELNGYVIKNEDNSVCAPYKTLKEAFRFISNHIDYQNIHNLKTESVPLLVTGKDDNTKLEVTETENIVDCLKTVKSNLTWAKKDKNTHQLLIIANNDRIMAVSNNGQDYSIATAPLETNQKFITVVPIERSNGFCKVLEVLKKQGKLNDLSYKLEDEKLIVSWIDGTFGFNTLPTEAFNISDELQVIIDEFRKDSQGYQLADTYETEETEVIEVTEDNQEDNAVNSDDNQELSHSDRDNYSDQKQDSNLSEVNIIEQDTPKTQYVYGVGDIPLLSIDAIESGMYIFFNSFIYIVSHVKKVDFINSKASYILTVTSLLNAVDTENILLTGNELLPAWKTQFNSQKIEANEAVEQTTEDIKPKRKIAKKATELTDSKYSHVKLDQDCITIKDSGINYEASDLPLPKRQPKANNGVKGEAREKLLRMVSHGCTLQDMMTVFNWSKKNAQNHTTYIRWWGYDLVRQGKVYKLA